MSTHRVAFQNVASTEQPGNSMQQLKKKKKKKKKREAKSVLFQSRNRYGGGGGGFFLAFEDLERMFDTFPVCAFCFVF